MKYTVETFFVFVYKACIVAAQSEISGEDCYSSQPHTTIKVSEYLLNLVPFKLGTAGRHWDYLNTSSLHILVFKLHLQSSSLLQLSTHNV